VLQGANHRDGTRLQVLVINIAGYVLGLLLALWFLVNGRFGSYQNLYCMVPHQKVDVFASGVVSSELIEGPDEEE
jgi:hypothetical protein